MIAAITTLMFLTVLWMLGVVGARMLAESGERIAAAAAGLSAISRPRETAAA